MILFTFYVAFGILNVTISYDQGILMIREHRDFEAWVEAILYILLWPLQVAYWVYTKAVDLGYWVQVRVLARWMS